MGSRCDGNRGGGSFRCCAPGLLPISPTIRRGHEQGQTAATEAGRLKSDEELMANYIDGDSAAFDALFERYARMLQKYLSMGC